jgi:hypothetical protein
MNILKVGPIEKLTRSDAEAPEYTRHVWFDVENGRLVATNGHGLVIAAVEPEDDDVTGPISREAIRYGRALANPRHRFHSDSFKCMASEYRFGDGARMPRLVTGAKFPDYEAIIPAISGPPLLTLNPETLAQIVAAFPKQEVGKHPGSISLWIAPTENPEKPTPIVIRAHYSGGLAVLMPVSGLDPSRWNLDLPSGKPSD